MGLYVHFYRVIGQKEELTLAFVNDKGEVQSIRSGNTHTLARALDEKAGPRYGGEKIPINLFAPEEIDPNQKRTIRVRQERIEEFHMDLRRNHNRLKVNYVET